MDADHLTIGFVRRGYSPSGGAESYLKRLAAGVRAAGHEARLITTAEWPENDWGHGPITRLPGKTAPQFADELEGARANLGCDLSMSLERVWQCDVYRAGDGLHRAWLARRRQCENVLRKVRGIFNRKHRGILRLEESLFAHGGAQRVIANSEMVKREIVEVYGCPEEIIDVVYNGVPVEEFRVTPEKRAASREKLGFAPENIVVLFAGSGWSRKGLRFAIQAVEGCGDARMQLLVAGKGNRAKYRSRHVRFLGEVADMPALYAAADIFLLPTIYDAFSNACLEALAAGLPVITTRGNGAAEIIAGDLHGSVVEQPTDVPGLVNALRFWMEPERREKSRGAREAQARDFALARNVGRTLQILLQFAEASAPSTSGKMRKT